MNASLKVQKSLMHSFSTYLVRVFGEKNKALDLNSMEDSFGVTHSLFDIFSDVFAKLAASSSGFSLINDDKKLLRYKPVTKMPNGSCYSLVEAGEWGVTQPIVSTKTLKTTHRKGTDEAGLTPFFVHLSPTKDDLVAVFVFHKQATLGVKTPVTDELRKRLFELNKAWGLHVDKIVPNALINKLLTEGEVKTIRFVSHTAPSDIADKLDQYASDENTRSVELVLTAKRGRTYGPQLLNLIQSKKPVSGLVTLPSMEYQSVKVKVEIGKRHATIDLARISSVATNLDITDNLKFDSNGHPTVKSLSDLSSMLVTAIEGQL